MAMERRRQRLLVAFALAVCALASRTTVAASDELLRGGRAARDAEEDIVEVRSVLAADEYEADFEKLLGRRKCLGLTQAWSPFTKAGAKVPKGRRLSVAREENGTRLVERWHRAGAAGEDGVVAETGARGLLRSRNRYHIPQRWQRPLTGRCRDEGKIRKNVKPDQKPVVDCLLSDKERCPVGEEQALRVLHATDSVKQLMVYETPCVTINKGLKRCATTQGNPETMRMGSVPSSKYSEEDVERNYTSCALIGNGPGLFKQNKAGVIDQHDAIFRFNSLHNLQYQGRKTTFRILNNKRVEGITKKRVKIKEQTPGEAWIMWHYFSLKKYAELKKINENSRIMAPDFLKFELRAYFGVRKDLKRFGNTMRCPMNLNSGMHGILMALKICDEVNLFGFSYQKNTVNNSRRNTGSKAFQSTVVSPRLSKHHDWHTDALVVKYLAMAGLLNIC